MLSVKRILFPTDFTVCADRAFGHASFLADKLGASLHVLNVDDGEIPESDAMPKRYSAAAGVTLTQDAVESDSPEDAILEASKQSDLVVMGTHGRRGLRHAIIGSVAEKTLRGADCPVMTVSVHATESAPDGGVSVKRILAAVDFSDEKDTILRTAAALAEAYGATVDVMHAVYLQNVPDVYGIGVHFDAMYPEVIENTKQALEPIVKRILPEGVFGEIIVPIGTADASILQTADDRESDLIVIATHGRSGLSRLAFGSVAESVIRRATCPVFTIPSFGRSPVAKVDASA